MGVFVGLDSKFLLDKFDKLCDNICTFEEEERMKKNSEQERKENRIMFGIFGAAVILIIIFGVFGSKQAIQRANADKAKMAAGMTYDETITLQGKLDGVKVVEASNGDAALAGGESAAASKALGGSNKEAAGTGVAAAILVEVVEHALAGCYAWVEVEPNVHKRFKTDDWVCEKYKGQHNVAVTVGRSIHYWELAMPGQHTDAMKHEPAEYTPKF